MLLSAALALAPLPSSAGSNNIVTTGQTQTTVQTSGNVTNVTTSTVSGADAFNAFSQFGVGSGNTVNLMLPSGTQNLINTVTNAQAYVNGTLNSYMNGRIGGNVYFADPQGFVVGAGGTINVGSLNISTPSASFVNQLIGPQGQINNTAVNNLINGSFPISPDGNIRILGRINAANGVQLTGYNVSIGGSGTPTSAQLNQIHAAEFAASVNAKGLRSANRIVVRNGSIQIVAGNDVGVSGRIVAHSRRGGTSSISIAAANNVNIAGSAVLSTASQTGNAGDITIKAANDLTVHSGATIDASSAMGNAGIVELSTNGALNVASNVKIDVGAPNGTPGTFLVDPANIVIGDPTQGDTGVTTGYDNADIAIMISDTVGGTFTLAATSSITLDPHAVIDTRQLQTGVSTGNALNVDLQAPTIDVEAGAQILTLAVNSYGSTYTSGNITLDATLADTGSATGAITVAGTLTGANITLEAGSTGVSGSSVTLAAGSSITGSAVAVTAATISIDASYNGGAQIAATSLQLNASQLNLTTSASAMYVGCTILSDSSCATSDTNSGASGFVDDSTIANYVAAMQGGGTLALNASSSISVDSTGLIDVREISGVASAANALNVVLTAPTITVAAGGQILAEAINSAGTTYTSGNVTLTASGSSGISVAGVINGGNITLSAPAASSSGIAVTGTIDGANITLATPVISVTGASIVAGTVDFDLTGGGSTVVIGNNSDVNATLTNATIENYLNAISGSTTFELSAATSITLDAAAVINAELYGLNNFTSSQLNVDLQAPTIDVKAGAQILAQSVTSNGTTYAAGNITLDATSSTTGAISVAGLLNGGNVTLEAGSTGVLSSGSSVTLVAGSSIAGAAIAATAGTIDIDASYNGGAQISTSSLQLTADQVNLTTGAGGMIVGNSSTDSSNISAAGFVANSTIAKYAVAMKGTGTLALSASSSITVDSTGVVDVRQISGGVSTANSLNVELTAPTIAIDGQILAQAVNSAGTTYTPGNITLNATSSTTGAITVAGVLNGGNVTLEAGSTGVLSPGSAITLVAGSSVTGGSVAVSAGTININISYNGGAQITAASLQLDTNQLNLTTSASAIYVGDSGNDSNSNAAGFVANSTIADYAAAMQGSGTLALTASSSITVDSSGDIDVRQISGGVSIANAVNVALTAPTIAIDGQILAQAVNSGGTAYTSGNVTLTATSSLDISAAATMSGGNITLSAPAISIASASITGGTFQLAAATSITLDPQAVIDTRGLVSGVSTGDAYNVDLQAPTINVEAGAKILTQAVNSNGTAYTSGTITLDATSSATGAITVAGALNGGGVTVMAGSSITLAQTAVIDTRVLNSAETYSIANSQNVTLTAPTITAQAGSQVLAGANNAYVGGNVTFDATGSTSGVVSASGAITGGNVTLMAGASVSVGNTATIAASMPSGTATITFQAPSISVASGASFTAPAVDYAIQQDAVFIGNPTQDSSDAGSPGFISNATVASYLAATAADTTVTLSGIDSFTIDPHGVVNAPSLNVTLSAPSISLTGGSSISGNTVVLNATTSGTVSIDAATLGGAQVNATTLQVDAGVLDLTSSAAMVVGSDASANLTNAAIAGYVAAMQGSGTVALTAGTSITLDATAMINTRLPSSGASTGNAVSVDLQAPTISVDAGAQIVAQAVNSNGTTYTSGNITLDATSAKTGAITVAGVLNGGIVTIEAGSTDILSPGSSITLAAGNSISGSSVSVSADTVTINVSQNGGAQISGPLQLSANQLDLTTSAAAMYVGCTTTSDGGSCSSSDSNSTLPGFVDNSTIASYAAAMGGVGTLALSASSSITVDPTGDIDVRQVSGGASTANALNVTLTAPTITVASGSFILAQAINSGGTTYTSGNVTFAGSSGISVAGTVNGADIVLSAPSIGVAGASINGSTVDFDFNGSAAALTVGPSGTLSNSDIESYLAAISGSSTFELSAATSITLNAGAVIDTRSYSGGTVAGLLSGHGVNSTSNSQSVTLYAPTITINSGAAIYADVNNATGQNATSYTAGTVILYATGSTPTMTVAGTITGGSIMLFGGSEVVLEPGSSITLAAGSSITGSSVSADADTINIDVSQNGGARIMTLGGAPMTYPSLLLAANELNLTTSSSAMYVGCTTSNDSGCSGNDSNSGAPGFVDNATIATYAAAMQGSGTLALSASSSIAVDSGGDVDVRQMSGGVSTGNSLNVALTAPTITVDGSILAQAVNAISSGTYTAYTPGNVTLTATGGSGITVAGTIKGATIDLTSDQAITLEAASQINALNQNGHVTGASFDIALSAPAFSVNCSACLLGNVVDFNFTGTGGTLIIGSSSPANLTNTTIASYIAAANGSTTFELSAAASITLDATADINGTANSTPIIVTLYAPTFTVASGATISASTVGFAFNQDNVFIGPTGDSNSSQAGFVNNTEIASLANVAALGDAGTLAITANDNITIDTGGVIRYANGISLTAGAITVYGVIDTRSYSGGNVLTATGYTSNANSGAVSLNAPTITIAAGGAIYAGANNGYTGGAVTLTANSTDNIPFGLASASTSITIDGTITANSISAIATSQAESVFALDSNNFSPGNLSEVLGISTLLDLSPLGLTPGYVQANGTATVTVGGTLAAASNSSGNITLEAQTTVVAEDPALSLTASNPFVGGSVIVGSVRANATVEVQSTAQISGGGALTVAATNGATVDVKASVISGLFGTLSSLVDFTVVYGDASVNASALIDAGAQIDMSGSSSAVDVYARNDNNFTAAALSYAAGGGAVGIAVAIGDFNSGAVAQINTGIGSSANPVGNVAVLAQDETASDQVSASGTAGTGPLATGLAIIGVVGGTAGQAYSQHSGTPPTFGALTSVFGFNNSAVSSILPKLAGAVAVALGTQSATADFAQAAGSTTPITIDASGNVAIGSDVTDAAFLNYASSAVNSPMDGEQANPPASLALSLAIAYADITHNSSAYVGPNVTIDANQIGVAANGSLLSPIENIDWSDFCCGQNSVLESLLANEHVVTTGVNATSASQGLGLAGGLDFATFNINTIAWVGDGATLDATGTGNTTSDAWTAGIGSSTDPNSGAPTVDSNFSGALAVLATTEVETINFAGQVGIPSMTFGGGVAGNGLGAVGVSLSRLTENDNTNAGIGQGALITSGGSVDVGANIFNRAVNAAPTNGAGNGISITGLIDLSYINDNTSASIANNAQVTADSVYVTATEELGVYTIAGDITFSGSSGVGIAITYQDLHTDTQAYIGNNSTVAGTTIDPDEADVPSAAGFIKTNTLVVDAKTSGNAMAISLVSEFADSTASEEDEDDDDDDLVAGSPAATLLTAVGQVITDTVSLTLSGASAITDSSVDTEAWISGAKINNNGDAQSVQVQAVNDSLLVSASGGVAITIMGRSEFNGAISGAISVEASNNDTLAYIDSSTLTDTGSLDVQALTGGLTVVAGLGVSVNTAEESAGTLAGSVSVAQVNDSVTAYINNSTITGADDAIVLADQDTEVGIGGGAFSFGGEAGLGLAITYVKIDNPGSCPSNPENCYATNAYILNSGLSGFVNVDVIAEAPQIVYSGAATISITTDSADASLGGAFIFNTLTATTSASISNTGSSALTISTGGSVNVVAGSSLSSLVTVGNSQFPTTDSAASQYEADFFDSSNDTSSTNQSAQAASALLSGSSSSIVTVAGVVQGGGANAFGVSLIVNNVSETDTASISGVDVIAPNSVSVSATDATTIFSLAVGIGIATSGPYSFEGSSVTNTIGGGANATVGAGTGPLTTIGTSNSSSLVGSLTVSAIDSSKVTAIALVGSYGESGAGGVAISTNNIETNTAAAIQSADVYTTVNEADPAATGDIIVASQSTGEILAVAAGIEVSESFGGEGSVATNLANGNVVSTVSDSTLFAQSNVGVLAANNNAINAVAGSAGIGLDAEGLGISVTTDVIGGTSTTGETYAKIIDSTVDAEGAGTDTLQIVDGALVVGSTDTSSNPENPSSAVTPYSVPSLGQDVRDDKGLAVVAGSYETSVVVSVTLGASQTVADADNVITNILGGYTEATVSGSALDRNLALSSAGPAIDVSARSVSFTNNLDIAIAGTSGSGADANAVVTNSMDRTTIASLTTTDVGNTGTSNGTTETSVGAITVSAYGWEGTSAEVIGGSGSSGANGTGTALANIFQADTTATVDQGTIDAGSLSVTANGTDGFFGAAGGAAGASTAGLGATVLVTISSSTTEAIVGDTDPSLTTILNLTGPLTIAANTTTDTSSYAIVGAVGGTAGLAAQFSGMFMSNTTEAALYNATVNASGDVDVESTETDSIAPIVGGLQIGGTAGAGAAVNLVMLTSNDAAWMYGDTVSTSGAVNVTSTSTRDVNPITVTASLAGQGSFAATVGVVLVGNGASSDEMSVLDAGSSSGNPNSGTLGNAGSATGTDVTTLVGGGVDGISAEILGGRVTAGSVNINATSNLETYNIVGSLAIGLTGGGIGAGVGYTDVHQNVTAEANQGSITSPVVLIGAQTGDDTQASAPDTDAAATLGIAGAGGLYVGLGAAVGESTVNNTVLAQLGSNTSGGPNGAISGDVQVLAADSSTLLAQGYGFAGGVAAVGISLANADKSSTVTADIAPSTTITNMASVIVGAGSSGSVTTYTIAGAAGGGAGAGAASTSSDTENVTADIGASSSVSASQTGVLVSAAAQPDLSATSIGVAVGAGVGLGASVAESDASVHVTAYVDNNSTISGGDLEILATQTLPSGGNNTYAMAAAGAGGGLLGAQGSYTQAQDDSTVSAYGGTGLILPAANVTISAQTASSQDADATGVAASGFLGVGATVSQASSDNKTTAYLGAGACTGSFSVGACTADTANIGILTITATGTDSNTAEATAGSGGVLAGAAAVGTTSTTSTTSATLYGNGTTDTLYFGALNVEATHTTDFSAKGNAYDASAVGASGGNATNTVTDNVTAEIGTNLIINSAGGNINVIGQDTVNETSGGAQAGSGGVLTGSATVSNSTVTQNVNANIDANTILSLNDDPATSTAAIDIEAYNFLQTTDNVNLVAGGIFAGGGGQSNMTATANDNLTIANGVTLFSAGSIDIGTASQMAASNNASASLYGLVSGAGASTDSSVTANQTVSVGNALIEAWGNIAIYAGMSGDGTYFSSVVANGTTNVWNEAIIPITATYLGEASAYDYTSLTLATGSRVLGADNVYLGATVGQVAGNGNGTNYNPYLSIFSTDTTDNSSTPAAAGSASVTINGTVAAGIYNQVAIDIPDNGGDPTYTTLTGASPYVLALTPISSTTSFATTVTYNTQQIQYMIVADFNPYQQIVNSLVALTGLTAAQVTADLQSQNQTALTSTSGIAATQQTIQALYQQAVNASPADAGGAAYVFGNILVGGGNVTILAGTLGGSGAVTAYGAPTINFQNQGTDFLELSNLAISSISGGNIIYSGAATSSNSTGSLSFTPNVSSQTPSIIIDASYNTEKNGVPVDQNNNPLTTTPDIYLNGTVTNVNGILDVTDQLGNLVASQSINVATFEATIPNGSFTFNNSAAVEPTAGAVADQWLHTEYMPTSTLQAVEAAATYLGSCTGSGCATLGQYGGLGTPYTAYYDCCSNGGEAQLQSLSTGASNCGCTANDIFTARLLNLYYQSGTLISAIFLPMGYENNNTSGALVPGASTLATEEGTSASNVTVSGWQRHWYQGQAYSGNDSGPFNCSGCGNYFQVIAVQPQAIAGTTAVAVNNPTNPPTVSCICVGKAVIISANIVDINGQIQSGQSSNFSVNIGTAALNAINNILGNPSLLASDKASAATGTYVDLTPYITTVNSGDTQIHAQYDAQTNQILLNNAVQGTGGYVYINGKIISTSETTTGQGSITVNGGAGTMTVDNTTGIDLVTNTINTGVSAPSVVEIVDQQKQQTTWYVYNAGNSAATQVTEYQGSGVTFSSYTSAGVSQVTQEPDSNISYAPQSNLLYEWVYTADLTRTVAGNNNADPTEYGWTFDTPNVPASSPYYPYALTTQTLTTGSQSTNFKEVVSASGTYVTNYVDTSNGGRCCGTDFNGNWYQEIYNNLTLKLTNTVIASYGIGIHFNGSGTSTVAINSNASVIVQGPINNVQGATSIVATGFDSKTGAPASITATGTNALVSGTSVTLNAPGDIGQIETVTTPTVPIPVQIYGGTLTANSVDNDIAISAIGNLIINHVIVSPTTIGNAPQGDVYIAASGDITSASTFNISTPIVVGRSVEIDSAGGAIGAVTDTSATIGVSSINPLVIEATAVPTSNGTYNSGLLNSTSVTGTYIIQSTGNLVLGTVQSTSGPVFLEAATGSILNGLSNGGLTPQQISNLQTVWQTLNLTGANSCGQSACPESALVSYQNMINGTYNNYWTLLNLVFTGGNNVETGYNPTTLGTTMLTQQIEGQEQLQNPGVTPPVPTSAQMQMAAQTSLLQDEYLLGIVTPAQLPGAVATLFGTQVTQLPAALATLFSTQAGVQTSQFQPAVSTTALTTALGTYNSSFSYQLPVDTSPTSLYSSLTSSGTWSIQQLTYTISSSANPANNVAPPSVSSLPLNVSGREVMLYAPDGSVGNPATPQTFNFSSVDASSLTPADEALISSAGPGQLKVTQAISNGVTNYSVTVSEPNLIVVSPLGPVAVTASSQIYLASVASMNLGGIPVADYTAASGSLLTTTDFTGVQLTGSGNVELEAANDILTNLPGQAIISGDITDLILISDDGNVGAAPASGTNPAANQGSLWLALSGGASVGALDQAVALQGGIYINQTTGDLVVGNITAGGAVQLAALGSIYAEPQFADPAAVHIIGGSLDLRAGGAISFNSNHTATCSQPPCLQPLQVQISGPVTGSANASITILSPSSNLTIGQAGTYGTLTSGGAMTLDASGVTGLASGGSLAIDADVTAPDALELKASFGISFAAGTSTAPIVAQSTTSSVTVISFDALTMGNYSNIEAAGIISVATTDNATLGELDSSASYLQADNGPSIIVQAGGVATSGAIFSNGDGRANILTTGTGAIVSLSASAGIGTKTAPLILQTPTASVVSSGGDVYLSSLEALEITTGTATTGAFNVTSDATLTLDTLNSGTTLNASTTSGSITIGSATSGGTQTITGYDNVSFNTLTTNGVTVNNVVDPGDINVTASTGYILATLATGNNPPTEVSAHGSASLTAALTITGDTLSTTNGSATLTTGSATPTRSGGEINWGTLTVGTTLNATSNNNDIVFGSATSGGTQTITGYDNVSFNALTTNGVTVNNVVDPGDINVTASTGYILATLAAGNNPPTEVSAHGSASLTAALTITGDTLSTTNGSASLTTGSAAPTPTGGDIDWTTLTVATTLNATSNNGDINFSTATSGGTQTIWAQNNVTFNSLTTTGGVANDNSDINVTAANGYLLAQTIQGANNTTTEGSVQAYGSAKLIAKTSNTGQTLTTVKGNATLQGQLIDWANLQIAGALNLTAGSGGLTIGTATTGGTMNFNSAGDIVVGQLTTTGIPGDPGDIDLTSLGSITGGSISANNNDDLSAGDSISVGLLKGNEITLSAPNSVSVSNAEIVDQLNVAANTINLTGTQLSSTASNPLIMNITGFQGGVAQSANVTIDPAVIVVDQLSVYDMNFVAMTPSLTIVNGYVGGEMFLTTPTELILVDDLTPAPSLWPTIQIYQPGGSFTLGQYGNADYSNAYVVWFNGDIASALSTYPDPGGSSFYRDLPTYLDGDQTPDDWFAQQNDALTFYVPGLAGGSWLELLKLPTVGTVGKGPAVNIQGLPTTIKLHLPGKPGGKTTQLLRTRERYGKSEQGNRKLAAAK